MGITPLQLLEIPFTWNFAHSVAHSPEKALVKTTRYGTDSFHLAEDSTIPNLELLPQTASFLQNRSDADYR
jgi:hypothetical protein